ncbi:MAG: hypothetical protein KDI92_01565 [Xanthomonadales bacterium]|nr:hypothetical protein [Xanthomonadales bacterium]
MKLKTIAVIFAISWPFCFSAQAAEFCVTNSIELKNALTSSQNNSQSDVIKIVTGSYTGGFSYLGSEDFHLTISGGWSDFFGNPCGHQIHTPLDTILDGNDTQRVMLIQAWAGSNISISNMAIIDGDAYPASAGGLEIRSHENYVGDVLVEKVAFVNNKGFFHSALATSRGRKITVRNNIFAVNENITGNGTVEINDAGLGIYFNNNTIVLNTSLANDAGVNSGLRATLYEGAGLFVANNLFWDNDGHDVTFIDVDMITTESYLYNNNIDTYVGTIHNVENNFTAQPIFDNDIFLAPTIASQEVNNGRNSPLFVPVPPPFNMQWGVGITDFNGNARIQDDKVDVGAIEVEPEEPIFKNGFEIIL